MQEGHARRGPAFFPRVEQNLKALRRAYDHVAVNSGHYVTPAADWLLDNFHLVEAQLEQIREGVPRRYYAELPKLAGAPLEGLPRVYGIAWAYVAHTDSVLDPEILGAFLDAYQEVSELRLAELWALPTTLRVVLLENLRRMADEIATGKVARELAHAVGDLAASVTEAQLDLLNAQVSRAGLRRAWLAQLWQRIPADGAESSPGLMKWMEKNCPDGPSLVMESQTAQVTANLTVGNIITTLRLIGQLDWVALIEPVSRSLQALRQLPSFECESELTRQQITRAMEQLARHSRKPELVIARAVVAIAQASTGPAVQQTAGYYLIGEGRAALAAAIGQPVTRTRGSSARLPLYIGAIALGTIVLLLLASRRLDLHGAAGIVFLFLLAWPASEAAASLVHRLLAESLKVQLLPRLELAQGIPAESAVLVVIPAMLTSPASSRSLLEQLERHWLANREQHAQFALLTDWADADAVTLHTDAALMADALAQVEALNDRLPAADGAPPRFLLIHRPRSWCETQRRWLGWERKRGKIELLVRALATGGWEGFQPLAPTLRLRAGMRFVLTLDSDTGLPPGALRELVAIADHPLNSPRVDPARRRVVAGYGILQPQLVTPLTPDGRNTRFHRLFSGQAGIDPYNSGVSDVYQDLFGTASFSGKGLLNVQACHAVLDGRLPGDSVLSHDLLEGALARCGYVSDVSLVEEFPQHPGVAASRLHRWTRGDWQLLPVMLEARAFGIDALGWWKMADNLRRSLVLPACAVLLALSVFEGSLDPVSAIVMVFGALLAGPLLGGLAGLVPTRGGIAWRHFFHAGTTELLRALAAATWQFSQLAAQAVLLSDAIARSLWRMGVSRRKLLEWTTAEQAQGAARDHLPSFLRQHAAASLLCAALAIASLWGRHPLAGILLFAFWACSPLVSWWSASTRGRTPLQELRDRDRQYLQELARDTWRFFERTVGAEDNHLPPDNLQLVPEPTVAHRTSPTNIGLYLVAVCCAREFGWISTGELSARLQATLDTIARLPRHRGHLLNWYDTRTLEILPPAYVSTVDSGNLAGLLLTVAQACRALARAGTDAGDVQAQLLVLAGRARELAMAMDFRCLYDGKRHLFHIGLRVQEQALDASYYDLLASEARLTSLLAIAKGDVPRRHWSALGRPFLSVGVAAGLKSWSGSMFEYLMPSLLLAEPAGGLLHSAACAAVAEQRAWGEALGLPWGISESAYFAQDHSLAFQYGPFGAPRLALRRTPVAERVIAPYATLLATMFEPRDATANLQRLQELGGRGELGMFEALDFTASRQPAAQHFSVVETFMAHHQGMALAALCDLLCAGSPRRWLSGDSMVAAHEMLLHESTPRQIVESADPRRPPEPGSSAQAPLFQARKVEPASRGWKPTHLLSNGRYSVALRPSGAGVSRWHGQNITRWRDDLLRDDFGSFFYVSRPDRPTPVSLTSSPAPGADWRYQARFMADRVEFDAQGDELACGVTVLVSPEDDTELRIVTLRNTGKATFTCELVSSFEPVLAAAAADEAHPAFSNLFIHTSWQPPSRALVMTRRPRLQGDPEIAAAHFLAGVEGELVSVECITDRRAFRGRNRSVADPGLGAQVTDGDGAPVNGLDPVACLRVRVRLAPGAPVRLTFATTAAPQAAELAARIDSYRQPMHVERAVRMAATLAQVRLRDLGLSPGENIALQDFTTALMYSAPRAAPERGPVDQRQLWRFGLSGDKPILLVRIQSADGIPLLRSLLRAQPWWTFGGLPVDMVVLNSEPNSYLMPLQREILALRDRLLQAVRNSFPRSEEAGFFLLRSEEVSASERAALSGLARVILTADGRPLEAQAAARREVWAGAPPQPLAPVPAAIDARAIASTDVVAPTGEFDAATGEFRFELAPGQATPRPWVNVIANRAFGFQVSEAGSGYTWAVNSRLHQLTAWSNDPVADPAAEHWLLQDLDSGVVFSATRAGGRLAVRHGQGYSVFASSRAALKVEATLFADPVQSVKVVRVQLHNEGSGRLRLRALGLVEWQLGANRGDRRGVLTWKESDLPALFAQQREQRAGFGGHTAFLSMQGAVAAAQWTCDRAEFFDGTGRMGVPATLAGRSGPGLDPCAAIAGDIVLAAGERASFTFVLGHATSPAAALQLAADWNDRDPLQVLAQVKRQWSGLNDAVQVRTPDPLFDALVNRWLLYQTVSSRLWSKAGFYQAGGASGFRDQLQDAMALTLADPGRLREQIVLNAGRQFPEGDVQHWWHAPGGEGVRTHFSDDLLWLPYACAHYLQATGDAGLLDQQVAFLEGPAIPAGAEDAYYTPQVSPDGASVYEHCARTIDHSLAVGVHGLPLMGTGDWNDGMNRVGHLGRGESVWLAWFLCAVTEQFAPLASARGDSERAQRWLQARAGWIAALHGAGWDGGWFRRAFFDDGEPLGSAANDECRIDLIAQAWAVLSGASTPAFTAPALAAVKQQLFDADAGLLLLLAPPLAQATHNPGYIQAYPPGVRENGGQYSHAAVWGLMAQALGGDAEAAWRSFKGISPAHRSRHPKQGAAYELEPYVTAGDTFGAPPYVGRGGWSWYTGSAGWLYRAAVETLLGLQVRPGAVALSPRLPAHWPSFELRLKVQGRDITLHWERDLHAERLLQPDLQVPWGEWVDFDRLPATAVLLVCGEAPAAPSTRLEPPAVLQPA